MAELLADVGESKANQATVAASLASQQTELHEGQMELQKSLDSLRSQLERELEDMAKQQVPDYRGLPVLWAVTGHKLGCVTSSVVMLYCMLLVCLLSVALATTNW